MRKLIDWIANRLGYQRKHGKIDWPPTYIPDSVMKEWEADNCLSSNWFPALMNGVFLQPTGTHEHDPFIVKD